MKYKRMFIALCASVLTLAFFTQGAFAQGSALSWYCKRNRNHNQPVLDASHAFIEELGGYYIDKAHGDSSSEKVIYLTFDAGYENGNVEKILDVMKEEGVKGAFFILANLIEKNPELVLRMAQEGHTVCNHTATHKDMTRCKTLEEFSAELEALERIYTEHTGLTMKKYFRPPEGKFDRRTMEFANELGYKTVFWSFAYADWDNDRQPSESEAIKKIMENIHNGEVMLLHPTSATNAAILGKVIRELRAQGFRFGELDELCAKQGGEA